jgi:hypothetical protein
MGKVIVTRTVVAAALSTLKLRHPLTLPDDVANMKKMLTMVLRTMRLPVVLLATFNFAPEGFHAGSGTCCCETFFKLSAV